MRLTRARGPRLGAVRLAAGIVILTGTQARIATAYERYNDGCHTCHGAFYDATSPRGTIFPGNSKHAMHANVMATNCFLCHRDGDNWNPYIGWSNGTAHNPPVGCTGCHGRDYGSNTGNSGAGLRAHHAFEGVTECATCHGQDPTPLPENVAPIYYGTPDTSVDDPCNRALSYLENWSVGDTLGLDNDGDGLFDGSDDDCCPGDIDLDGDVDIADFGPFADSVAGPEQTEAPPSVDPAYFARADLDLDKDVDLVDFAGFQRNLGDSCD